MRQELEEKLVKRFPTWFGVNGDSRHSLKPFVFQCGEGWFNLLWRLCVDLEPIVTELEQETGEQFEVGQVREKLGTLRFYVSHHSDAINERIAEARTESAQTCETCGQPGNRLEVGGRIRVRCDKHGHRSEVQ